MLHKILVAINNSEIGEQVFDQALFLAKATDAELMLVMCFHPLMKVTQFPQVHEQMVSIQH